jgi:hypothetical protein
LTGRVPAIPVSGDFREAYNLFAAREASSKRVKETAASHKTRVKEKALETSTQRVQTMLETYQGTNSGQFPNGRTNLENVSSRTANNLPVKHCQLTLLFFYDGCE